MQYRAVVEYIPEPGFDIEWGWEAKVEPILPPEQIDFVKVYEISSTFSYGTKEEAQENFRGIIKDYVKSLAEERVEVHTVDV